MFIHCSIAPMLRRGFVLGPYFVFLGVLSSSAIILLRESWLLTFNVLGLSVLFLFLTVPWIGLHSSVIVAFSGDMDCSRNTATSLTLIAVKTNKVLSLYSGFLNQDFLFAPGFIIWSFDLSSLATGMLSGIIVSSLGHYNYLSFVFQTKAPYLKRCAFFFFSFGGWSLEPQTLFFSYFGTSSRARWSKKLFLKAYVLRTQRHKCWQWFAPSPLWASTIHCLFYLFLQILLLFQTCHKKYFIKSTFMHF